MLGQGLVTRPARATPPHVGLDLLLRFFDRLGQPYFTDTFTDQSDSQLRWSQDVYFCQQCARAGIPIFVNWDSPAGHWQLEVVEMPGWENLAPDGSMNRPESELGPVGADPTVPVLRVRGTGDKSWG